LLNLGKRLKTLQTKNGGRKSGGPKKSLPKKPRPRDIFEKAAGQTRLLAKRGSRKTQRGACSAKQLSKKTSVPKKRYSTETRNKKNRGGNKTLKEAIDVLRGEGRKLETIKGTTPQMPNRRKGSEPERG